MRKHERWYDTARWRRRCKLQLMQNPLCAFCLQRDGIPVAATVADHIEPMREDERRMWFGALQNLCARCHSSIKAQEEALAKPRPRIDVDGWPVCDGELDGFNTTE